GVSFMRIRPLGMKTWGTVKDTPSQGSWGTQQTTMMTSSVLISFQAVQKGSC
ncbi:hypothetical protein AGOR_G00253020, partial [Albula goreensis]